MPNCNVYGCTNGTENGFVMKQFPSSEDRRKEWLEHLKIDGAPVSDALICEAHFPPHMWEDSKDGFLRMLKHDAVPTLFEYRGDELPSIPYSKARKCAAFGCYNRDGFFRLPSITLHQFPIDSGDEELLKKWVVASGQLDYTPSESSYMCSDHFKPNQLQGEKTERTLVPGAYPTVYKTAQVSPFSPRLPVAPLSSNALNPFIEILGLHEVQEDVNSDVLRIALFFGVELLTEDIDRCLVFKKKHAPSGDRSVNTIIVKFSNLSKKQLFLDAYKNSVKTLMDTEWNTPISISDEMSPTNKKLLMITEKIQAKEIKNNEILRDEKTKRNIVYKKVVKTITPQPLAVAKIKRKYKPRSKVCNAEKSSKVSSKQTESSSVQPNKDKIDNDSSCSKDLKKKSIRLSKSTTEESVESPNETRENVERDTRKRALGTSEISLDESIEKTLESMGLEVEGTSNAVLPTYTFEDEKDLVEEALESFGLNVEPVEKRVLDPISIDRNSSQSSKKEETDTNNSDKEEGSIISSKKVKSEEEPLNSKRNRKRKTFVSQPEPESMEVDNVVVKSSIARSKRTSKTPVIETNGSSLDEKDLELNSLKEESEIVDEPDSSMDSFTYNMLKDSAAQCKVDVKIVRLDQEIVKQYQSAAIYDLSKPFKKRFSTEHLEETSPQPGPSSNKIKRSKKRHSTDSKMADSYSLASRSKRKVIQPKKFEEFDCNFPRTSSHINCNEKTEEVNTKRKKSILLTERDSNKCKTVGRPRTQKSDKPFGSGKPVSKKTALIPKGKSDMLKTTRLSTDKQFGSGEPNNEKIVSPNKEDSVKLKTTKLSTNKQFGSGEPNNEKIVSPNKEDSAKLKTTRLSANKQFGSGPNNEKIVSPNKEKSAKLKITPSSTDKLFGLREPPKKETVYSRLLILKRKSDKLKTTRLSTDKQFGSGPDEEKIGLPIEGESDKLKTSSSSTDTQCESGESDSDNIGLPIERESSSADTQFGSGEPDDENIVLPIKEESDKLKETSTPSNQVEAISPRTKKAEERLPLNRKRKISDTTKSLTDSSGGKSVVASPSGGQITSTSSPTVVKGPVFNLSNVRSSLKEKLDNKDSNVTKKVVPSGKAPSSMNTPVVSKTVTPGSAKGKSLSVTEGSGPCFHSIALPVSNYSPPETSSSTNFKLIANFQQLIQHLREKHLLKSHVEDFLFKNFSHFELYKLMRCMDNKSTTPKYSRLQTRFALVLYLFSFDCYVYLCTVFSLPNEEALYNAMLSTNFQPGILVESLNFIDTKLKESGGSESINYHLVVDLVPIQRNITWDKDTDSFIGYSHLFETFDYQNNAATQAVFIMLCFLNENLNIPVAYYPVDFVHPEFLASVIKSLVNCLYSRSIKPVCIVLDASSTSFSCAELLGCSLGPASKIVSTYTHQVSNMKMPIFFDTHHLAKEARDWFSRIDVMSSNLGLIEWKYVQFLNERLALKYSSDLKLSSDLFTMLKLDLNLAEAMEDQRRRGDTDFEFSEATIHFIKSIDKALSAFDFQGRFSESAAMLTGVNIQKWFLSVFCPYFEGLKVNSLSLKNHNKINFVNSCFYNMNSLCLLYDNLISENLSYKKDLPRYKLTLDSIDMFFYLTFKKENNGTPDCLALKCGLRKYMDWIKSKNRFIEEIPPLLANFRSNKRSLRKTSNRERITDDKRSAFYVESLCRPRLKVYKECVLILVSNLIREYLVKRISCIYCLEMLNYSNTRAEQNTLLANWQREFTLLYNKPSNKASRDIFKIVQVCDEVFDRSKCALNLFSIPTKKIISLIQARTRTELFENNLSLPFSQFNHPVFNDDTHTTHENYLTTLIIKNYVHMRMDRLKPFCPILL